MYYSIIYEMSDIEKDVSLELIDLLVE